MSLKAVSNNPALKILRPEKAALRLILRHLRSSSATAVMPVQLRLGDQERKAEPRERWLPHLGSGSVCAALGGVHLCHEARHCVLRQRPPQRCPIAAAGASCGTAPPPCTPGDDTRQHSRTSRRGGAIQDACLMHVLIAAPFESAPVATFSRGKPTLTKWVWGQEDLQSRSFGSCTGARGQDYKWSK